MPLQAGRGAWLGAAAVLAGTVAAWAAAPTPSPGPAARVGSAIDRAWGTVQDQVADALLLTRVRVALLEKLGSDGLRVQIEAKDGAVALSGQVQKATSPELALEAARSVRGVREVRSTLTVAGGSGTAGPPVARAVDKVEQGVSDAVLEAKVKGRLLEEIGRVAFDVDVHAAGGVVTLSGTVPDEARRHLAVRAAKETKGVKELRDLLKVKD